MTFIDLDEPPDDYFWDWGGRREPLSEAESVALDSAASAMGSSAARSFDAIVMAATKEVVSE